MKCKVRIRLELVGITDRDPEDWGVMLASFLENEINDNDNAPFGRVKVEYSDSDILSVEKD